MFQVELGSVLDSLFRIESVDTKFTKNSFRFVGEPPRSLSFTIKLDIIRAHFQSRTRFWNYRDPPKSIFGLHFAIWIADTKRSGLGHINFVLAKLSAWSFDNRTNNLDSFIGEVRGSITIIFSSFEHELLNL